MVSSIDLNAGIPGVDVDMPGWHTGLYTIVLALILGLYTWRMIVKNKKYNSILEKYKDLKTKTISIDAIPIHVQNKLSQLRGLPLNVGGFFVILYGILGLITIGIMNKE